jgi:RNA polymerase sigma-B factor
MSMSEWIELSRAWRKDLAGDDRCPGEGICMRIDVRRLGRADLVLVTGALDLRSTAALRAVLDSRVGQGRVELVVDLRDCRLLDAGAVGMLVGLADRVDRLGGRLRVVRARGICLEVLRITGVDKRLSAYDEPEELVASYAEDSAPALDPSTPGADAPDPDAAGEHLPEPPDVVRGHGWSGRWPYSVDITVNALLAAVAGLAGQAPERADLRRQVIEDNMAFARRLAWRFRDRGEPTEDLVQVAMVGLVNAVDGYDPARGYDFAGYAAPTVGGEIRRYFRDKGWRVRVPRRLQELRAEVSRASVELGQLMGTSPTVADLARHLDVGDTDVVAALEAAQLYRPASLQAVTGPGAGAGVEFGGDEDPDLEAIENRESVRSLLAGLPERERRILVMRFFQELSQSQIATELGISQMHVSRLLTKTLSQLRGTLAEAG